MKRQPLQDTTFFRLTPGVRDRLLEINLTAAEWRIWCYLVSLDPFGDRGAKFVPAELMLKCKIKKTTYFSAKAKFQKLGLFDFRDGVTRVVNLQTFLIQTSSSYSQQAKIIDSEISESEFGKAESESLKPLPRKASKMQRAIAEFQKRMGINQPIDEPETEEINSIELQRRNEELNKLIDNPPKREKSLAQQRREEIAKAKQQQRELDLERKKKNAERQRQQELDEPDPEKRKAKMIRETEEFLRNRQQQNPEISEEGWSNE